MWRANHVHYQKSGRDLRSLSPEGLITGCWTALVLKSRERDKLFTRDFRELDKLLYDLIWNARDCAWDLKQEPQKKSVWKTGIFTKYRMFLASLCWITKQLGHGPWLWRVTAQLEKKTPWHFSQLAMSGSNLQPIWPDLAPWWPSSNSDYPQTIAPVGVLSKLLKLQRVGHKFPTYEGELAMLIPTNTTSSKAIKKRPYGFMVTTHWWRQKPTLRACPPSGVRTSPSARSKWHSSTCLTHIKCQRAQQMLTRQSLNNQNYKGLLAITCYYHMFLGHLWKRQVQNTCIWGLPSPPAKMIALRWTMPWTKPSK
jgi:hypothetical protein